MSCFWGTKRKKRGSGNNRVDCNLKVALYTVWIFICIFMSLRVFRFAKNMKFLTKGGIHCISRSFLGTFILCVGTHWCMMTVLLISLFFLLQMGLPHQTFIQYGSYVDFVMICTEYRVCSLHADFCCGTHSFTSACADTIYRSVKRSGIFM